MIIKQTDCLLFNIKIIGGYGMSIQKIGLGDNKELIIRTKKESFSSRRNSIYYQSISEVIVKDSNQFLCIGICFSNSFTGASQFIQYTSQCILFLKGNSITKSYYVERVFDIESMSSHVLTKDDILKKYNIELSEDIKDLPAPKKRVKLRTR